MSTYILNLLPSGQVDFHMTCYGGQAVLLGSPRCQRGVASSEAPPDLRCVADDVRCSSHQPCILGVSAVGDSIARRMRPVAFWAPLHSCSVLTGCMLTDNCLCSLSKLKRKKENLKSKIYWTKMDGDNFPELSSLCPSADHTDGPKVAEQCMIV